MSSDNKRERTNQLTKELKKVQSLGYIYKTSPLIDKDTFTKNCGVELFLDTKVPQTQIRKIVNYITTQYNFDAWYYTKSHSIKVWYRNVK